MFQRFNIPPGSIENLYNNADVLEFTKWTISNSIRNNVHKGEVEELLNHGVLSRLGWTQAERNTVMNKAYLQGLYIGGVKSQGRHFTDAEIAKILGGP